MAVLLVAYDISDDERRNRLANRLLAMGFSRIQRSVYVHPRAYSGLKRRTVEVVASHIDPRTDRALIMVVPDGVYRGAVHLGQGGPGDLVLTL